jgi:hypothetical protein
MWANQGDRQRSPTPTSNSNSNARVPTLDKQNVLKVVEDNGMQLRCMFQSFTDAFGGGWVAFKVSMCPAHFVRCQINFLTTPALQLLLLCHSALAICQLRQSSAAELARKQASL